MIWNIFSFTKRYPDVVVSQSEGFVDLQFKISSIRNLESGVREFVVKGTLNDAKIGFAIELLPDWQPKEIEGLDQLLYWGGVNFKSIGAETSAFLLMLSKLYDDEIPSPEVYKSVPAVAVGLACNPNDILSSPCKIKLFFNSNSDQSLYCEIFLNIDVGLNILELNEKDIEYRRPLLRSLGK